MYRRKEELCNFNQEVECDGGNCNKCGWNPKISAKRREKLRIESEKKRGIERQVWQYE